MVGGQSYETSGEPQPQRHCNVAYEARDQMAARTTTALARSVLDSFRRGEDSGVREVYLAYNGPAFAVAWSVLGDRELTVEAVQETFDRAWRAAGRYDPTQDIAPWLFRIARRVSVDIWRARRRYPLLTVTLQREGEGTESSGEVVLSGTLVQQGDAARGPPHLTRGRSRSRQRRHVGRARWLIPIRPGPARSCVRTRCLPLQRGGVHRCDAAAGGGHWILPHLPAHPRRSARDLMPMRLTRNAEAKPLARLARWSSATAPVSWVYARILHRIDALVYRRTGGRHTASSLVSGLPVTMLTTTGARTGQERTLAVLTIPDGDDLVLIASNFGQSYHPAWYHNLRAHPRAKVTVEGVTTVVEARETVGEERERLWRLALEIHPGWRKYERRAAAARRRIPVLVLTPVRDQPPPA
jgi:deazaflavin-dependent oxidoreductase (nitroreductase family)